MTTRSIAILGSGGHARVVADVCQMAGRTVRGFVDPARAPGSALGGVTVLGGDELLHDPAFVAEHDFLVGVGDQRLRRELCLRVRGCQGTLVSVVHPSAVVARGVRIGAGTVLVAGCVVNPGSAIGDFAIINTGATVDHDNVLADGVHVGPGVHLAGDVRCGEDAFLGTGAVVIRGRRVGARAVVGAGAVVIRDVADGVTVVGCPAEVVDRTPPDRG